jgi:NAD+ kinase
MKTAAIISKPAKAELTQIAPELAHWLRERGYEVIIDREGSEYMPSLPVVDRDRIPERNPDFVVVLGGDGTLLSAARAVASKGTPIVGVNLGSLGFLTEIPVAELYETLEAMEAGRHGLETRSMIHCQLIRNGKCEATYEALNDAVLDKSAIARLVVFDLYLDGSYVSSYKADGVIVSSPTGSTAYSLAAGGPILMPTVDAFVICPVCPHSLTHRPLVVRDRATIEIIVKSSDQEAYLSIDGQIGMPVVDGDRLVCRKSDHHTKLVRLRKSFFEVLRTKLKWGER